MCNLMQLRKRSKEKGEGGKGRKGRVYLPTYYLILPKVGPARSARRKRIIKGFCLYRRHVVRSVADNILLLRVRGKGKAKTGARRNNMINERQHELNF